MASTVVRRMIRPLSQLSARPNCALKSTSAQCHLRCLVGGAAHRPILTPAPVEFIPSRCIQSTGELRAVDLVPNKGSRIGGTRALCPPPLKVIF